MAKYVERFESIKGFDDLPRFAKALNRTMKALASGADSIVLDWTEVDFIEPPFLVASAALVKYIRTKYVDVQGTILAPRSEAACRYLASVEFMAKYVKVPSPWPSQPMPDFVPIEDFTQANPSTVNLITEHISRHVPIISDKIAQIEGTFDELMSNVVSHSQSPIGGVVTGQFYPSRKRTRIAICDFGVSIPGHLSRLKDYSNSFDNLLIEASFRVGVTAADPTKHSGQGLPFVKEVTRRLGGVVRVYSRHGAFVIEGVDEISTFVSEPFPGTIITIDWPAQ